MASLPGVSGWGDITTMAEEEVGGGMLGSSWNSSDRLVSVCDAVQVLVSRYLWLSLKVQSGA